MTDFEVANYFELETMFLHEKDANKFNDWKQFYQSVGRRPEFDVLIQYTNGNDERIEVKAQDKNNTKFYFEYDQVYKGDNIDDIYPAGLRLSDSDYYYIYKYDNKKALYNYVRNRYFKNNVVDTKIFKYDLYKIPTEDIKKWYQDTLDNKTEFKLETPQARYATITNNKYSQNFGYTLTVNMSFLSKYLYFSSHLTPLDQLNKYFCKTFQYTEEIYKYTGYLGISSERPVLDEDGEPERETRVIDVLQFKKNGCKKQQNKSSADLLGSGKNSDSSSESDNSSSSEEEMKNFYKKLTKKIKFQKK